MEEIEPIDKKLLWVSVVTAIVGVGVFWAYKIARPRIEIRKYLVNGRIQKPRKWTRTLRKRNRKKNGT